jgi:histidine triad (HIT) family protein
MFVIGKRVAEAIRCTTLECEGAHFFLADGAVAGQDIPHVHLHVVPRHGKDGFGLNLPDRYFKLPPRSALDTAATSIREALKSVVNNRLETDLRTRSRGSRAVSAQPSR